MFPDSTGFAYHANGIGGYVGACGVQPHPVWQGAFFGSGNPNAIVFNFDGLVEDVIGWINCASCPSGMRYQLYDANGNLIEDEPVVGTTDAGFQRTSHTPCKKLVITPPSRCLLTQDPVFTRSGPRVQRYVPIHWGLGLGQSDSQE
jgi:hypothetical protein